MAGSRSRSPSLSSSSGSLSSFPSVSSPSRSRSPPDHSSLVALRGRSPPPSREGTKGGHPSSLSPPPKKPSPPPPPARKPSPASVPDDSSLVLLVSRLSHNFTEGHFREIFENYGKVVNVELSMDKAVSG